MTTFHLQIATMDGNVFDGQVQSVSCRTIHGDLAILFRPLILHGLFPFQWPCSNSYGGPERKAACIGGMLTMMNGECRLIPTTWEWSEDIDVARAEEAKKRAEDKLSQSGMDDKEVKLAEAKLHRALVRIGTVGK